MAACGHRGRRDRHPAHGRRHAGVRHLRHHPRSGLADPDRRRLPHGPPDHPGAAPAPPVGRPHGRRRIGGRGSGVPDPLQESPGQPGHPGVHHRFGDGRPHRVPGAPGDALRGGRRRGRRSRHRRRRRARRIPHRRRRPAAGPPRSLRGLPADPGRHRHRRSAVLRQRLPADQRGSGGGGERQDLAVRLPERAALAGPDRAGTGDPAPAIRAAAGTAAAADAGARGGHGRGSGRPGAPHLPGADDAGRGDHRGGHRRGRSHRLPGAGGAAAGAPPA